MAASSAAYRYNIDALKIVCREWNPRVAIRYGDATEKELPCRLALHTSLKTVNLWAQADAGPVHIKLR